MFGIFQDMKPERIQLFGDGGVVFLSIVLGSFTDAVQVLNLIAWGLTDKPGWAVESAYFEDDTLEVRIVRTSGEETPEDAPAPKS